MLNDHKPVYEDNYEQPPPDCEICGTQLNSKWEFDPETELYVIAGTYFEDIWNIAHELEPRYLICMKCFEKKIKPLFKK